MDEKPFLQPLDILRMFTVKGLISFYKSLKINCLF
jgi:hypothetical protein